VRLSDERGALVTIGLLILVASTAVIGLGSDLKSAAAAAEAAG